MRLVKVAVGGYKKFATLSSINVDTKVVAVVGPNEVGKTSLLRALAHLSSVEEFEQSEVSRDLDRSGSVLVQAIFLLENVDLEELPELPKAESLRWLKLSVDSEGRRKIELTPALKRDLSRRREMAIQLERVLSGREHPEDESEVWSALNTVLGIARGDHEVLVAEDLEEARRVGVMLGGEDMVGEIPDINTLRESVLEWVEDEEDGHPNEIMVKKLRRRIPEFLFFSEEDRQLESSYVLEEVSENPPKALRNLTRLAGLKMGQLNDAVRENDSGYVETLTSRANRNLEKFYTRYWGQSGVVPRIRVDGENLQILVGEDTDFYSVAERSDGLRWFIALASFVHLEGSEVKPILLVDEADRHLHYDAQADLVQLMAEQEVAEKTIYTTHSLGCLPEDLGAGIKVVVSVNRDEEGQTGLNRPGYRGGSNS